MGKKSGNGEAGSLRLKEAQTAFHEFLQSVRARDMPAFLNWVCESFSTERDDENKPKRIRDANEKMEEIAAHIRERVPVCASLKSESIRWPKEGHDSDCNEKNTVHVDCFLFDEDAVDELVDRGELTRNYCVDCGSKNTKPLTFISHSLAPKQLEFLFTSLVDVYSKGDGYRVVDIGSRLGAVVYAASLYSNGRAAVTGIELNEEMCDLQKSVCEEQGVQGVEISCGDVRGKGAELAKADLVVMNNVFSFFMSNDEQVSCWDAIKASLRPGCLLLHHPSVETVTEHLQLGWTVDQWLERIPIERRCADFAGDDENLFEDLASLCLYRVRGADKVEKEQWEEEGKDEEEEEEECCAKKAKKAYKGGKCC